MDEGSGNGDGVYMLRDECIQIRNSILFELREIKTILRGSDSRSGVVKDVNYLLDKSRLLDRLSAIIIGVISTIITAYIITRLGI